MITHDLARAHSWHLLVISPAAVGRGQAVLPPGVTAVPSSRYPDAVEILTTAPGAVMDQLRRRGYDVIGISPPEPPI